MDWWRGWIFQEEECSLKEHHLDGTVQCILSGTQGTSSSTFFSILPSDCCLHGPQPSVFFFFFIYTLEFSLPEVGASHEEQDKYAVLEATTNETGFDFNIGNKDRLASLLHALLVNGLIKLCFFLFFLNIYSRRTYFLWPQQFENCEITGQKKILWVAFSH